MHRRLGLMMLRAYRSSDKRIKTEHYNSGKSFAIAEVIGNGSLITEFDSNGEIINQVFSQKKESAVLLEEYVKPHGRLEITSTEFYAPVKVNAVCTKCGSGEIYRELDFSTPSDILKVPVVPLFICKQCRSKFYSMTDRYLRNLVASNPQLFEKDELLERERDENAFIAKLQDNIIRIFAAKKINKLKILNK